MQQTLGSLPLELGALSVASELSLPAAAAPRQSDEGSVEDTTLVSLPTEILALLHSRLLQADPSLRSCLALEATCKHLRSVLLSNTRFKTVTVDSGRLATAQGFGSFWRWIATHGRRTGGLHLKSLALHHSTAQLCSKAGVLQVRGVVVTAPVLDTLEPLRGLLNLSIVVEEILKPACVDVSLEPLAGLPALQTVCIKSGTTSLAPLRSMAALTRLSMWNDKIRELDDLRSLSKLSVLHLVGCRHVSSVAPLSCLTALTHVTLKGFSSLDNVAPLRALSRLQRLKLEDCFPHSISLQPLCQLTLLSTLILTGRRENMTTYDLQPLSALSRSLQVLDIESCVLRNLPCIGSLGSKLAAMSLIGCEYQRDVPLASTFSLLASLTALIIFDAAATDLDSMGQHLKCLQALHVKPADTVTSLAALTPLTLLTSVTLGYCRHISSIDPLTALTQLHSLYLHSCSQLTSLSALTALQSLRQLRLEGCPQLAASLPSSLQPLLAASSGQHV
jgi:Leucine-rich repeat (LRR) protein